MKIGQEFHPQPSHTIKETERVQHDNKSFHTLLSKQQTKLQMEKFQQLLADIDKQGERLAQLQTAKELKRYKRLVQRFVKEAVDHGLDLKKSRNWNNQGRISTLTTVEKIDAQLLDLTEAVLCEGKSSLVLLQMVGEIKGLLINLYT